MLPTWDVSSHIQTTYRIRIAKGRIPQLSSFGMSIPPTSMHQTWGEPGLQNKYFRISNVIYPGPPAVVRFIIWLHSSLAMTGAAASHYEMLPKITYETYPWFNFQIPSYPRTMTYKYYVDFTILHATSSHSLLSSSLSVVLTPQAFAPASGLLGLCHQL